MKKILLIAGFALVLLAGCRPQTEEPTPEPQANEQEGEIDWSLLYTDNDPFWGPQEDYMDGGVPWREWTPSMHWSVASTVINAALSLIGWAIYGIDQRGDNHDATIGELNRQMTDLINQTKKLSGDMTTKIKDLSNTMGQHIQLLMARLSISRQIALGHNTIDRLNDLTNYINTANQKRNALLNLHTAYYTRLAEINQQYGVIAASDQTVSLAYYKAIYQLLDEWAQPDYSSVVESITYPHFLASQNGTGMPAVYAKFVTGCCAWNSEAMQMRTMLNFLDLTTALYGCQLTHIYLSACSYLNVGPDPLVCHTWQQQNIDNYLEYLARLDSVKPCTEVECYIPGAHFKADTLLTEIDFANFRWIKNQQWDTARFVYGGLPQGVKRTDLLSDTMAAMVMQYYKGSGRSLCRILVEDAGFRMPANAKYEPEQCAILFNGRYKRENNNIYCAAGYSPLYYGGIGSPMLMGTLRFTNNKPTAWQTFEQPNIWLFAKTKK